MPDGMKKQFLNSFDYIAAYLAHTCRNAPAGANDFFLELITSGPVSADEINVIMQKRTPLLPELSGRMKREFLTLAPYWKPGRRNVFTVQEIAPETSMESLANMPRPKSLISVFCAGKRLIFRFPHTVFDGIGAERFVAWLFSDAPPPADNGLLTSRHLNDWKRQMESGRTFREILLSGTRENTAALCAAPDAETEFITETFPAEQLIQEAEQEAGPFMTIPYLVNHALEKLLPALPENGAIVVPMTVDQRGQEDQAQDTLLFNHWSLLPLFIPESARHTKAQRLAALRRSFFEGNAKRIPAVFRHASFWARIVPFFIMRKMEKKYGNMLGGTFMFSYIDGSTLPGTPVCRSVIEDVRHYPVMPPRPGIGFFYTRAGDRLHLTISRRRGVCDL